MAKKITAAQLKLKVAAKEIKKILRKHDIASSFALHTLGHSEYVNHFLTSYSCAYQYEDDKLRFYAKQKDFKTKEEFQNKLTGTANMMHLLTHTVANNFMMLEPLSKQFDEMVNAVHK